MSKPVHYSWCDFNSDSDSENEEDREERNRIARNARRCQRIAAMKKKYNNNAPSQAKAQWQRRRVYIMRLERIVEGNEDVDVETQIE